MGRLFNTIALEINALCNRRCSFCPVAYNHRPDERMDWRLLDKSFDELSRLKYAGRIEFYIYSEPTKDFEWLLKCLCDARRAVPRACLMIATNGDYLRGPDNIMRLYDAGLNQLLINCYSPGLYEKRLAWLQALPSDVQQDGSVYSYIGPRRHVVNMLDKSDPSKFGSGVFRIINRAGNIPAFAAPLAEPVNRMCVKPFRLLNINWKGDALVCCNDYHAAHSYGNLRTSTLVDLWNSPVMNEYRRRLYKKDRSAPLCRTCDCHAGAYPHMVEKPTGPYAKELK